MFRAVEAGELGVACVSSRRGVPGKKGPDGAGWRSSTLPRDGLAGSDAEEHVDARITFAIRLLAPGRRGEEWASGTLASGVHMPDSIAGLPHVALPDATKIGNYCTEYFHEIYFGGPVLLLGTHTHTHTHTLSEGKSTGVGSPPLESHGGTSSLNSPRPQPLSGPRILVAGQLRLSLPGCQLSWAPVRTTRGPSPFARPLPEFHGGRSLPGVSPLAARRSPVRLGKGGMQGLGSLFGSEYEGLKRPWRSVYLPVPSSDRAKEQGYCF